MFTPNDGHEARADQGFNPVRNAGIAPCRQFDGDGPCADRCVATVDHRAHGEPAHLWVEGDTPPHDQWHTGLDDTPDHVIDGDVGDFGERSCGHRGHTEFKVKRELGRVGYDTRQVAAAAGGKLVLRDAEGFAHEVLVRNHVQVTKIALPGHLGGTKVAEEAKFNKLCENGCSRISVDRRKFAGHCDGVNVFAHHLEQVAHGDPARGLAHGGATAHHQRNVRLLGQSNAVMDGVGLVFHNSFVEQCHA